VPTAGALYLACSLATSDDHTPTSYADW
jgi:hypothetical protein